MTLRKKIELSFALLLVAVQMYAQSPKTSGAKSDSVFHLSLQQSIQYALANQPNVRNAKYEVEKATARVHEITGMGLPQITGSVSALDYLQIPTTLIPGQFFGGPAGSFEAIQFGT